MGGGTMKTYVLSLSMLLLASLGQAAGTALTYDVDGKPYEGYFISPKAQAPLVLLVHDWDGLTDYEVKRAGMLADLGYAVFAVDLFGKGVRPAAVEDKRRLTGELYQDRAKMRRLLFAAFEEAGKQGGNVAKAVVMGYCFGGAAVLEFARAGAPVKGFVTFHGGLDTPQGEDYGKTRGSLLIFHGTADASVTMEQFANLATELERQGVSHEMTTYSGAPHAFTVFGTERYREDADRKSWRRFIAYLEETLH